MLTRPRQSRGLFLVHCFESLPVQFQRFDRKFADSNGLSLKDSATARSWSGAHCPANACQASQFARCPSRPWRGISAPMFKRDYVSRMDLANAATVMEQLPGVVGHFNSVRPHSSLKMRWPREFRQHQQRLDQIEHSLHCEKFVSRHAGTRSIDIPCISRRSDLGQAAMVGPRHAHGPPPQGRPMRRQIVEGLAGRRCLPGLRSSKSGRFEAA